MYTVVDAFFAQIKFCFTRHWVDQQRRYILNKNAINQALQCTRKKPLIDWLIRNRWWLRRQANSNFDSNYGLKISRTKQPSERSSRWANKQRLTRIEWISAGSIWLTCELELHVVCGTLLVDVKQAILSDGACYCPTKTIIFDGVPGGPSTGLWTTVWLKISALKRTSSLLGTPKSGSASGNPTICFHFWSNGMERDGMFDVTLGSTMASTDKLLPPR